MILLIFIHHLVVRRLLNRVILRLISYLILFIMTVLLIDIFVLNKIAFRHLGEVARVVNVTFIIVDIDGFLLELGGRVFFVYYAWLIYRPLFESLLADIF